MTAQTTGGYRCNVCGMIFNSMSDLDAHTREKHSTDETKNDKTKTCHPILFLNSISRSIGMQP
jgi:hypothetical protein